MYKTVVGLVMTGFGLAEFAGGLFIGKAIDKLGGLCPALAHSHTRTHTHAHAHSRARATDTEHPTLHKLGCGRPRLTDQPRGPAHARARAQAVPLESCSAPCAP